MPKLGKKSYPYTKAGKAAYKKAKRYLKELYRYSDLNFFREPISIDNSKLFKEDILET